MFICIVGTASSGKRTIRDYLVQSKGFIPARIVGNSKPVQSSNSDSESHSDANSTFIQYLDNNHSRSTKHTSFLFLDQDHTPLSSPAPFRSNADLSVSSPAELLDYVTRNWRTNYVTLDLKTRDQVELFTKRPFFMLVRIDAPLSQRYKHSDRFQSLEDFVMADDRLVFESLEPMRDLVDIQIINNFQSIAALHEHLEQINLQDPIHLRPNWDTYFMTLASLASRRSNCMKRRVGAILVRENRILATGYNGTPRGVTNCNEGGCPPCNGTASNGEECVCLHGEENALLEAGRERVGTGAVLYCNTCPCLKCTVKIIQTGVKEVVYNLAYKVDAASSALFSEAGVCLRRFDPKKKHFSPSSLPQDDAAAASVSDLQLSDQ